MNILLFLIFRHRGVFYLVLLYKIINHEFVKNRKLVISILNRLWYITLEKVLTSNNFMLLNGLMPYIAVMASGADAVEVRSSSYALVQQDLIEYLAYCSTPVVLASVMATASAEVKARLPSASSKIQVSISASYLTCTRFQVFTWN